MNRRDLDGQLMGDSTGRLWWVYEPAWWDVRRWWRWWGYRYFSSIPGVGHVQVAQTIGKSLQLRTILAKEATPFRWVP